MTPDGLFFFDPGYLLRSPVKRGNFQVGIHGEDPVGDAVQYNLRLIFG